VAVLPGSYPQHFANPDTITRHNANVAPFCGGGRLCHHRADGCYDAATPESHLLLYRVFPDIYDASDGFIPNK